MGLPVVPGCVGGEVRPEGPPSQPGYARVDDKAVRQRATPGHQDRAIVRFDSDLCPQPVHGQSLQQRVPTVGGDVQHDGVGLAPKEEIEQEPPRRRQQGTEAELAGCEGLDILGQQTLQECTGVGTRDPDQGAVVEAGDGAIHGA